MKFSIVVPSLNQARFLPDCIDSLLSQTDVDLEVIVGDGGSEDDSVQILKSYGNRISWTSGPDGGQAEAINQGFSKANGEILGYLNSDDVLLPGALSKVEEFYRNNPETELVYGEAYHIDEDGQRIAPYRTMSWSASHLGAQCPICQPAAFWKRSIWERVGGFESKLECSMDYEFWIRIFRSGGTGFHLAENLAASRDYEATKTRSRRQTVYQEIISFQKLHLGRAHAQWYYEYLCYLKWERRVPWRGLIPQRLNQVLALAKILSFLSGGPHPGCRSFFDQPPMTFEERTA